MPKMQREIKLSVDAKGHESRAFEMRMDMEDGKLRGYAAVYDALSEDIGGFRERIMQRAFSNCLAGKPDVRALWQHNTDYVLGRTKSGTLTVVEDIHGLRTVIDPPDTQWARDCITTIKRGDVDQMSFAFTVRTDEWNMEDGMLVRSVIDADLFDVSPVTFPAYPQTSISARSVSIVVPELPYKAALDMVRRRLQIAELEV